MEDVLRWGEGYWEGTGTGGVMMSFLAAEDGQCMYLHPVNVRCLVREYGSLEKSPEKITAAVVEITGYSMTEVAIVSSY